MNNFHRYKLTIEYDGMCFHGWQKQKDAISVQQAIEEAIFKICHHHCLVEGAGRTDKGVHATGQVAHFDLPQPIIPYRLQDGLNFFLAPLGISILYLESVAENFHARFSAVGRTYIYKIINRRSPNVIDHQRAWHVVTPLDIGLMQKAAKIFIGTHDFSAFRASFCQSKNPTKTIDYFSIQQNKQEIICEVSARSFLHNQVRIMVGTLKEIGQHKIAITELNNIIKNKKRENAGITAPPYGLYLTRVDY